MTTTSDVERASDVPTLPVGMRVLDDSHRYEWTRRVIGTERQGISETEFEVSLTALQNRDGTICLDGIDPPRVWLDHESNGDRVSVKLAEARQVARALMAAADQWEHSDTR